MSLAVLIPAYNAAHTLPSVLRRIESLTSRDLIIVVDDGSEDNTAGVAIQDSRVHLIRHERNQGYGRTSITLYEEAVRLGASIMVNIHADEAHFPEEIASLVSPIAEGSADVVVGSRTMGIINKSQPRLGSRWFGSLVDGTMPTSRYVPNLLLTAFQNLCFGTNFHSFHDGFRACSRQALEKIPYQSFGNWYQFDTEFLLAAHAGRLKIREVGVSTRYLKNPPSATPRVKYGLRVVSHATRYALRRLRKLV